MFQTAAYSDQGGRPCNEDTVQVLERAGALCALVADGLGGHGGGDAASQAAAEVVRDGWSGGVEPDEAREMLLTAHQRVLAMQTPLCSMKTTAVLLLLEKGRVVWAHAGDSRLYWFLDGKIRFQTLDHSVAQMGVILGDITPDEIRFHQDRNRVLRALGQDGDMKLDVKEEALPPGRSVFLLCTDGFWEYVLEEEMERELAAATSPGDWLERMRNILQARVKEDNDNNTAAAVWVNEEELG